MVEVGDRFQSTGEKQILWVVERISTLAWSQYPLVILARDGHPDLKKTLSVGELETASLYTRVEPHTLA